MHFIVYNMSLQWSSFPLPRSPETQTGQHVVLQVAAQTPVHTKEETTQGIFLPRFRLGVAAHSCPLTVCPPQSTQPSLIINNHQPLQNIVKQLRPFSFSILCFPDCTLFLNHKPEKNVHILTLHLYLPSSAFVARPLSGIRNHRNHLPSSYFYSLALLFRFPWPLRRCAVIGASCVHLTSAKTTEISVVQRAPKQTMIQTWEEEMWPGREVRESSPAVVTVDADFTYYS